MTEASIKAMPRKAGMAYRPPCRWKKKYPNVGNPAPPTMSAWVVRITVEINDAQKRMKPTVSNARTIYFFFMV